MTHECVCPSLLPPLIKNTSLQPYVCSEIFLKFTKRCFLHPDECASLPLIYVKNVCQNCICLFCSALFCSLSVLSKLPPLPPHGPAEKSQIQSQYVQARNSTRKGTSQNRLRKRLCACFGACPAQFKTMLICIYMFHPKRHSCAVSENYGGGCYVPPSKSSMAIYTHFSACPAFQNNAYIYISIFHPKRHSCAISKSYRGCCHASLSKFLWRDFLFLCQRALHMNMPATVTHGNSKW
jgi:hypothetical protein